MKRKKSWRDKASDIAAYGFAGSLLLLFVVALVLLCWLIPAGIFFWCWKTVLVPVFHAPPVTFLQMYAITAAVCIIGGTIGKSGSSSSKGD